MINLYNQLIIFAFLQSIFLLVVFLISPKYRSHISGYMAVLIFALFLGLGGKILYSFEVFGKTRRLILISEVATILFGCTAYLFTKSSLFKLPFDKNDLYHYVPAAGYLLLLFTYFFMPKPEGERAARMASGEIIRVVYLFHAATFIINLTYWIKSIQVYQAFQKSLQDEVSYAVRTQFFRIFLGLIGAGLLFWLIVFLISITQSTTFEIEFRLFIWLTLGFTVLFLAFYAMVHPEIFQSLPLVTTKKYAQSKLNLKDLERLKQELEQLMETKKPYLNNKLLKSELSELLGVSNPEMARLLNEKIGMNFFEFVNYYRIKEFIQLVKSEKGQQLTFFGLAQEAGFNSKTTFNKSFKKLMGVSPSQYFKNGGRNS